MNLGHVLSVVGDVVRSDAFRLVIQYGAGLVIAFVAYRLATKEARRVRTYERLREVYTTYLTSFDVCFETRKQRNKNNSEYELAFRKAQTELRMYGTYEVWSYADTLVKAFESDWKRDNYREFGVVVEQHRDRLDWVIAKELGLLDRYDVVTGMPILADPVKENEEPYIFKDDWVNGADPQTWFYTKDMLDGDEQIE